MNRTIEFLRSLQDKSGGFRGWAYYDEVYPAGPLFPEVTGYLIPTLLQYGEVEMAKRAAEYLASVQNLDGSWCGMDGDVRHFVFDTSACIEGLRAIGGYDQRVNMAIAWIKSQVMPDTPHHIRVHGLFNIPIKSFPIPAQDYRVHYWAYALEGLYMLGHTWFVKHELEKLRRGLQSYTINGEGTDVCATAQIARLRLWMNMDASSEISFLRGIVSQDGSLPHGLENPKKTVWSAKFYLDVEHILKEQSAMDKEWFSVKEFEFKGFDIDMDKWKEKKPFGISGMFRVRSDPEFLYSAVTSHLPYLDEAVVILQPSDQATEKVIAKLSKLPKVRIVRYPVVPIWITDPKWESIPVNSISSFVFVSNWSLAQCRYSWIAQIEADVICCSPFQKIVDRVRSEPGRKILYGRVILNVAGMDMDQVSATVPRNGGFDEKVFPNRPDYHYIVQPKYEALESPYENECMGWSALHMKRCKVDKIGWNDEKYVPFDRESVAAALRAFNSTHPYPGPDNPEGEDCLFGVL